METSEILNEIKGLAETGKIVAFYLTLFTNVIIFWIFLTKRLRSKTFFVGQWKGQLHHDDIDPIECVATFYKSHGGLEGEIYFRTQGANGRYKKGLDLLDNQSSFFVGEKPRWWFFPVSRKFVLKFRRDMLFVNDGPLSPPIDCSDPDKVSIYDFEVVKLFSHRLRHPRMRCSTTFSVAKGENPIVVVGDLVRLG